MIQRKSRRIQTTIALAFAALVLVTALVLAGLSFAFTRDNVESTALRFTGQLISQVQTNIDSYITHMTNIADVVRVNDQVQRYVAGDWEEGDPERDALGRSIESFLNSISRTRDDISLILIAGGDGEVLTSRPDASVNDAVVLTELPFFRDAIAVPGQAAISSSHVQNVLAGNYRWVISLSRTLDDRPSPAAQSVLLVDLTFYVINDLVNRISLGTRGYLFLVGADGSIVYHPRQELIYSGLETEYIDRVLETSRGTFTVDDEKGTRVYTVNTSEQTGWRIVGVNYLSELVGNQGTIQRTYLVSAIVLIALAILTAVLISHRVSQPILRLRSSMQQVERGEFDMTVEVAANNEIGELARDYNIMVAKIRELMRRNAHENELKRRSELLALQNQITPHFLYNTLDSIIWMAHGRQHENVVETVSALARLLRLSISKGDELIRVEDEVEHIKSYLIIQKVRYRDRLDFSINVHESIITHRIPKVVLQPLVENAIYHGIKNAEGGGSVTIEGRSCSDGIRLSVIDDGVGMSDDQIARVLEEPAPHSSATSGRRRSSVGVRNVHERIRLYFGEPFGLSFSHRPGGGTIVEVHLPAVAPEDAIGADDQVEPGRPGQLRANREHPDPRQGELVAVPDDEEGRS